MGAGKGENESRIKDDHKAWESGSVQKESMNSGSVKYLYRAYS